jgi:hypothetical protein
MKVIEVYNQSMETLQQLVTIYGAVNIGYLVGCGLLALAGCMLVERWYNTEVYTYASGYVYRLRSQRRVPISTNPWDEIDPKSVPLFVPTWNQSK